MVARSLEEELSSSNTFLGLNALTFAKVGKLYSENAWLSLFSAAFTPIPFKIFTIASGVFTIPLTTLLTASALGRGGRFMLVAVLVWVFGERLRHFIETRFELLTIAFTVLLIGGFMALKIL